MLRRVNLEIVTYFSETRAKLSALSKVGTFFRLKETEVKANLFLYSFSKAGVGGGVRLSPLGTSATAWPTVPAPDDG
jgi:hypothetical protein